uniref:hypothetical protein n=1 Tax=Faecalibacterium sp. TaxID=1971605 RepID=UPI00402588CA
TISSFLESCAISAIVIGQPLLCFASGHFLAYIIVSQFPFFYNRFLDKLHTFFGKKRQNSPKAVFQRFILLQLSKASCPAGAVS